MTAWRGCDLYPVTAVEDTAEGLDLTGKMTAGVSNYKFAALNRALDGRLVTNQVDSEPRAHVRRHVCQRLADDMVAPGGRAFV